MKKDLRTAFEYFVNEIYPTLPPSEYKNSIRFYIAKYKNGGISNGLQSVGIRKIVDILDDFGFTMNEHPAKDEAINYFNNLKNSTMKDKLKDLDKKTNKELRGISKELDKRIEELKKKKGIKD